MTRLRGRSPPLRRGEGPLANKESLLAQLYAASISGTLVMGKHPGQRQRRLFGTLWFHDRRMTPPMAAANTRPILNMSESQTYVGSTSRPGFRDGAAV